LHPSHRVRIKGKCAGAAPNVEAVMPNPLFLLVPFTILTSGYAYVALRLASPFGLSAAATSMLWAFIVGAPVLHLAAFGLRFAKKDDARADRLHWASFVLMGGFAIVFSLSVVRDATWLSLLGIDSALDFAGSGFKILPPDEGARRLLLGNANLALLGVGGLASAVGFVEARRRPRIRHVEVPIEGLDPALEGFTFAQLSDVHVGATIKKDFIESVVDAVNAVGADAVVITGDLVDGDVEVLREHTAPLASLKARHGAFFVTGNHEYYSGAEEWVDEVRRLGITVLMNEHRVLEHEGARLVLAGVTDYNAGTILPHHLSDPARALEGAPHDAPRVLLAHQPRTVFAASKHGVDLQLSGHTHGGQFWPWNHFVPLQQPFVAGLDRHDDTLVYTSRGTGYWGPPVRLFAPSEISVVRLVRA